MLLPLTPGEMREIVTLRRPTTVQDALGQHTHYEVVTNVAAKVEPLRGREFFAAGATQSPASLRVTIYWRHDVQPNWRLDWMGRAFELVADPIDVEARHQKLELMCQGLPAGAAP